MSARLGRITARLAEPIVSAPPDLVDRINRNIGPPAPVRADDVHIRAMFIVSDQVNSFGGCFPLEEHRHLAELLVDSPVLVGHRKDKLPVARTFHATTIEKDGRHWVKAYFYWLRSAAGAEDLRENVDGGIYKECSIGFTFAFAECSICGRDIRLCEHEPFQTYTTAGRDQECHFRYRQIERVLESSLVYRGATPDTHITRELGIKASREDDPLDAPLAPLTDLSTLDPEALYLVIPRYDYVPCTVVAEKSSAVLTAGSGERILQPRLVDALEELSLPDGPIDAALVGYRGKERCPIEETERFLQGQLSTVRRLVLYLIPSAQPSFENLSTNPHSPVRVIPHRFANRESLLRRAKEITTREGIEIREAGKPGNEALRYFAHPDNLAAPSADSFRLLVQPERARGILSLSAGQTRLAFILHQFNRTRLDRGTRFLADPVPSETLPSIATGIAGSLDTLEKREDALLITLGEPLDGSFVLRPITLNGHKRFLFYRASAKGESTYVA